MMPDDKSRGSWPSASAWQANRECPGRHLAQLDIPEPDTKDPDCEKGIAIHAAWSEKPIRPLTPDELETLEALVLKEAMIVRHWMEGK